MANQIRDALIREGVRQLREFGYPKCDADNILTGRIYRDFFRRQLANTVDEAGEDTTIGRECIKLLGEIDKQNK